MIRNCIELNICNNLLRCYAIVAGSTSLFILVTDSKTFLIRAIERDDQIYVWVAYHGLPQDGKKYKAKIEFDFPNANGNYESDDNSEDEDKSSDDYHDSSDDEDYEDVSSEDEGESSNDESDDDGGDVSIIILFIIFNNL